MEKMSRILHKDTLTGFRLYYRLPMAMLPDDLTVTTSCIFYYPTLYISSFEGLHHGEAWAAQGRIQTLDLLHFHKF